jgi:hypothetical protein
MKKITELTKQQADMIPVYRARWIEEYGRRQSDLPLVMMLFFKEVCGLENEER